MSMIKKTPTIQSTTQNTTETMDNTKVRIANGAGRKPIIVDYIQGETFEGLFARTGVRPHAGQIVTNGKKHVRDFHDLVEPGTTIVIANRPNNG